MFSLHQTFSRTPQISFLISKSVPSLSFLEPRNKTTTTSNTTTTPSTSNSSTKTRNLHNYKSSVISPSPPRVLITGGLGQLGFALAKLMRSRYGDENVLLTDIRRPEDPGAAAPFAYLDVTNSLEIEKMIVEHRIDSLVHFSALLSAIGETNLPLAFRVNIDGFHNVLNAAKNHRIKLFVPSTIGAFGPDSPRDPTPDLTIQRPRTIYGVSKVHCELMGEYYHDKFGLDFRSLRLPGVISAEVEPGGGTTDYACAIFEAALTRGRYECFLKADTYLPMMYIDDVIRAIFEFMEASPDSLRRRTYNINAMSFCPSELAEEVRRHVPDLEMFYAPDARQVIADSWPKRFDDSGARRDWGWRHQFGVSELVDVMIQKKSEMIADANESANSVNRITLG